MSNILHLDQFPGVQRDAVSDAPVHRAIYKTHDRKKRKELWGKAENILEFYERFRDVAHPGSLVFERYGVQDAAPPFAQFENVDC